MFQRSCAVASQQRSRSVHWNQKERSWKYLSVVRSHLLYLLKVKMRIAAKEGRALRTETPINDTYDFAVGRTLCNRPALREIGFKANRGLLDVQTLSHDCSIGEDRFQAVIRPQVQGTPRASGLPFGDLRVLALMYALCLFGLLPQGFTNADLRVCVAALLGEDPSTY